MITKAFASSRIDGLSLVWSEILQELGLDMRATIMANPWRSTSLPQHVFPQKTNGFSASFFDARTVVEPLLLWALLSNDKFIVGVDWLVIVTSSNNLTKQVLIWNKPTTRTSDALGNHVVIPYIPSSTSNQQLVKDQTYWQPNWNRGYCRAFCKYLKNYL